MAASDPPPGYALRPLRGADLSAALALSGEAGWNQLAADWQIFLDLGNAWAVTAPDGAVVATAATLLHGGRFGWIGMVLVTAAHRRRGLASQLLGHAIAALEADGLVPALDATPAGREVYRGLGFEDAWGMHRLVRQDGRAPAAADPPAGVVVRALAAADWPALAAYDAAIFGADRTGLLGRLARRLPQAALLAERQGACVGFLLGRDGRVMAQLGPLEADDPAIAAALLARGLAAVPAPLAIDLADRHGSLATWLGELGFVAERPLTRMVYRRRAAFDDGARLFAIAGPELG